MILLWLIRDQKKWEQKCKERGVKPAVSMADKIGAYFLLIPLPILLGILRSLIH